MIIIKANLCYPLTITLSVARRKQFFTYGVQMVVIGAQSASLVNEGLITKADFVDFKNE